MHNGFINPVVGIVVEGHRLIAHGDFDARLIQLVNQLQVGIVDAIKLFEMGVIQHGGGRVTGNRNHKLQLIGRNARGDIKIHYPRDALQSQIGCGHRAIAAGDLEKQFYYSDPAPV